MKATTILAVLIGSAFSLFAAEKPFDCQPVSQSLKKAVVGKTEKDMLKLLEKAIESTPQCSCELIQSAIKGYKPKPALVGTMVDTAIKAAPNYMEDIVKCALSAAPDAEAEILTVAMDAGFVSNPLDSAGSLGQNPQGQSLLPVDSPAYVNPPVITDTDSK